MDYLKVVLTALGSVIVLFLLTKLMGNRQISQLNMFDYIISITIGSIAAEMATELDEFYKPLIALIIYALADTLITIFTNRSLKLRRILTGETLILLDDGKLYEQNFKKSRLDLSEFMSICRSSGYFNISDLQTAIFEPNGKISFLTKSTKRPANPEDHNIYPQQEKPVVTIILDGKILHDNLEFTGNNHQWLQEQLIMQGIFKVEEVFLATCDSNSNLSVYVKQNIKMTRDMFE